MLFSIEFKERAGTDFLDYYAIGKPAPSMLSVLGILCVWTVHGAAHCARRAHKMTQLELPIES